jgi:hypothetical protein
MFVLSVREVPVGNAVVLRAGDRVGQWGAPAEPGFTEYATLAEVAVESCFDGVVTLQCAVSVLHWWGDMNAPLHLMKNGGSRHFQWADAGVHTVRSDLSPEPAALLIPKIRELSNRVMGNGWFNDSLFKETYVLSSSIILQPNCCHLMLTV